MKKHIFGFVLFSLIVASFVLVYAFFNAPSIPPKEAVKPPIARTETREEKPYLCNLRRNKISYEVQSSELDVATYKFISKLTLHWDGYGTPPKEILVEPQLFTLDNVEKAVENPKILSTKTLINPFKTDSKTTVLIISDQVLIGLSKNENVYVAFNILDVETGNYLTKVKPSLNEAHQVLLSYSKNSTTKSGVIVRGRKSLE